LQARYLKALEVERLRSRTAEENLQTMHVELQAIINVIFDFLEFAGFNFCLAIQAKIWRFGARKPQFKDTNGRIEKFIGRI
jgi:hypothetical protein